ncbi:MAG: GNAT family N-acetyltransferase [Bacilli bacterium]|nr:GNAT family N-acetyltransferase [Bacilli bacterium]
MKIRKLKEKDADRMFEWMHYEETKDIFEKDFSKYSKDDILKFIKMKKENEIHFACTNDSDNYLGTISLKNIDSDNLNAELAISFLKETQGTGAASFAMKEILKYGFDNLKLNKIYLNVLSTNIRAKKFYKKMGFEKEGVFKKHIKKGNLYVDLEWYAFFR